MKHNLPLLFLFFSISIFSQNIISGKVVNEINFGIPAVLVVNINTDQKTYTDLNGDFSISANAHDELRFIKSKFERTYYKIEPSSFYKKIYIIMLKTPVEIKEVEILPKLSGDLKKDSKNLTKNNKVEELQNEIGVPRTPEKQREKPAEVKKDILQPLITGRLNINAIYDVVSGKSKRQKRLYQYDDLQENVTWVRKNIEDDYFINLGIPTEKISNFIEFCFAINTKALKYAEAKNISGFLVEIEEPSIKYLERTKN
jgi:hypothetical protein